MLGILMCKDIPVYDIEEEKVLDSSRVPGLLKLFNKSFLGWLESRMYDEYNIYALNMAEELNFDILSLMNAGRGLSLSDCYWIWDGKENVKFEDITYYLNWKEKSTLGEHASVLMTSGSTDKYWKDPKTLVKRLCSHEGEAYELCRRIGFKDRIAKTWLDDDSLCLENFTTIDKSFESYFQSGRCMESDEAGTYVEEFGEPAVSLFVLDYCLSNSDRTVYNYGYFRDTNTGEYLGMSPYFDYDQIFEYDVTEFVFSDSVLRAWGSWILCLVDRISSCTKGLVHEQIIKSQIKNIRSKLLNIGW